MQFCQYPGHQSRQIKAFCLKNCQKIYLCDICLKNHISSHTVTIEQLRQQCSEVRKHYNINKINEIYEELLAQINEQRKTLQSLEQQIETIKLKTEQNTRNLIVQLRQLEINPLQLEEKQFAQIAQFLKIEQIDSFHNQVDQIYKKLKSFQRNLDNVPPQAQKVDNYFLSNQKPPTSTHNQANRVNRSAQINQGNNNMHYKNANNDQDSISTISYDTVQIMHKYLDLEKKEQRVNRIARQYSSNKVERY